LAPTNGRKIQASYHCQLSQSSQTAFRQLQQEFAEIGFLQSLRNAGLFPCIIEPTLQQRFSRCVSPFPGQMRRPHQFGELGPAPSALPQSVKFDAAGRAGQ